MSRDSLDDRRLLPVYLERPRTRGDCYRMPRPCPWVSCRYHLYLDIDGKNNVKINHPDKELDELAETCALDAAGKTSRTLEDVALLLAVTRERVRQIEQGALGKVLERATEILGRTPVEGDDDLISLLGLVAEAEEEDE